MDLRTLFSHPLSSLRQWALEHERFIAVNLSWTIAVGLIIFSIWKLLHSLGIL
ncbi:MAG: hypothetical protein J6M23_06600 [Bacteroidales bacterium]|nr:hypothetical protein [Bacteroidales bacterium]